MMRNRMLYVYAALALLVVATPLIMSRAQDGGAQPQSFNDALADLGRRVGRTLTLADFDNPTSRWEWRGTNYTDTSLQCPNPGEAVTPATVIGYQFIFVFRGRTYDYRVEVGKPATLRLCTNPTGATFELSPLPTVEARTEPPPELQTAFQQVRERLELPNLNLDTDFEDRTSRWSWRWRNFANSQLECPSQGVQVDRVATGGWQFIFVYLGRTFDFRMKNNDPTSLFLCRDSGNR
jgi:hypothetical protein